jgi:hypothetical protein
VELITYLIKPTEKSKKMKDLRVNNTDNTSCADRITESLSSLNVELAAMMENPNHDDYFDEPALSIDSYTLTSICLSYGGPSSYLEVKHQGSDIVSVTYRFSDWYDTATVLVSEWEPAYEYARGIIEGLE